MIACKIESFLFKKANFKRRSCFQFFSSSVFGGKNEAFTFVLQQTICAALKEQRGKPPFFGHIKSNPAFGCTSRRASSTAFFSVSNAHKRKVLGAHVDLFSSPSWSRDSWCVFRRVQVWLVSSPSVVEKLFILCLNRFLYKTIFLSRIINATYVQFQKLMPNLRAFIFLFKRRNCEH